MTENYGKIPLPKTIANSERPQTVIESINSTFDQNLSELWSNNSRLERVIDKLQAPGNPEVAKSQDIPMTEGLLVDLNENNRRFELANESYRNLLNRLEQMI